MDEDNIDYIFIYTTHPKDSQKIFAAIFSGYRLMDRVVNNVYYDQNDEAFVIFHRICEILKTAGYNNPTILQISAERYSVFTSLFNNSFIGKRDLYTKICGIIFDDEYENNNINDEEDEEEEEEPDEEADF